MTNNNIEILPWTPPRVAQAPYATEANVIDHLHGEGWTTKEITEFMNATYAPFGERVLLTFDQWEDAALEWVN